VRIELQSTWVLTFSIAMARILSHRNRSEYIGEVILVPLWTLVLGQNFFLHGGRLKGTKGSPHTACAVAMEGQTQNFLVRSQGLPSGLGLRKFLCRSQRS